jgi:hypothetical protein
MQENENWKSYLNDGLHFSEEGNNFLWEKLKSITNNDYIETKTLDFPSWRDVDLKDPNQSLVSFFNSK